jgi:hypothetical protein
MGYMKNELTDREEALYEEYVESQREELRKEGAEELRIEILRLIRQEVARSTTSNMKFGLLVAETVVEQAAR